MDSSEREAYNRIRVNSSKVADDIDRIARRETNAKKLKDTQIRKQVQAMIRKLAQEGKSKLGIMNRINMQFRGEFYKPYRPYFESWVDSELKYRIQSKASEELER